MISILLSAAQENGVDTEEFLSLYHAYKNRVYLTAFRILKSKEMAEDASSQTWLRAIEYFDRVKSVDKSKQGAYLATIAKNTALNLKKREGSREEFPEEWENFYPAHSDEPQRRYENLVEIIRRMPERYRQILELKFVLEWSNKEIAAFLNMKESSVASRIARGRSMLRAKLEEEERDGVES